MKNLVLTLGLIVSLISVVFNVWVFGFNTKLLADKEEELAFISYSNLYLSAEFNHAENIYFKSRQLEYLLHPSFAGNLEKANDSLIKMLEEDLGTTRIKAMNYALNSSIDMVSSKYNNAELAELQGYLNLFNSQKKLESNTLEELKGKYTEYYQRHESYILKNMNKKIELRTEISNLERKNSWMKAVAISLQTIGLILVFMKDYQKNE